MIKIQRRKLLSLLVVAMLGANFSVSHTLAQDESPTAGEVLGERQPSETPQPEPTQAPTVEPRIVTDWDNDASGRITLASADANVAVDAFITPSDVRAGDTVTYTYRYTNTSGATINNLSALVTWSAMRSTDLPSDSAQVQFCNASCAPTAVSGPTVTYLSADSVGNNVRYAIGALTAGAAGQFSVVLRTRASVYPKTGQPPTRPATSVQLFEGSAATASAQDTVSALIIGPVLMLSKVTAPGSPPRITLGETVDFQITIGNATGPGDIIDGVVRADARTATNVTVVDRFPAGSVYVPTADPPGVTRQAGTDVITWTISSLAPQASNLLTVRFRKPTSQTDNAGCASLDNSTYHATSNEYPMQNPPQRYRVDGRTASIEVVPALDVASMTFDPGVGYFNESVTATLIVRNHYTQTVNGARVLVTMPTNGRYRSLTASPPLGAAEPSNPQPGQTLAWTINMPPGTAVNPSTYTITFGMLAERIEAFDSVSTRIQVPTGVPAGCLQPRVASFMTRPRLAVEVNRWPTSAPELIDSTRPYTFALDVTNNGNLTITNATITGLLPSNIAYPASFSYVVGSATVDGVAREPDSFVNGNGGTITWRAMTLKPRSSMRILFSVIAQGYEYVSYCVNGAASSPIDPVARFNGTYFNCVRINPPMVLSKEGDRDYVTDMSTPQGREVTFTLMITNTGTQTYNMGLLDKPGDLTFVRQVSSNNGTPTYDPIAKVWRWPTRPVGPGQRLEAVVVFRLPPQSNSSFVRTYANELGFVFLDYTNNPIDVVRIPPMIESVSERGILFYKASTEQMVYGPRNRIKLIIDLNNGSPVQPMSSVNVRNILPLGFTFESMAPDSDFSNGPSITTGPNGRQQLSWQLPTIQPQTTRRVVVFVRAPTVIGSFENWLTVNSATGLYDVLCQSSGAAMCSSMTENGANVPISIYPIAIDALATLEPELTPDACVLPGDTVLYKLSLVNTNNHAYGSTLVTFRLPYGVSVTSYDTSNSNGVVTLPAFTTEPDGSTTVTWSDINLPARPLFGAPSSQIVFFLTLSIGRFAGNVPIIATATSPDGDILRKDDVLDPALRSCPQASVMLMKESNRTSASANDDVIFQISLVNPLATPVTATINDMLPPQFAYQTMLVGPAPNVAGQTLTWSNINVPALANGVPGTAIMRFRARVVATPQPGIVRNTAVRVSSSVPINEDLAWTEIEIMRLPPTATPTPTPRPISSPTPRPSSTPANTPSTSSTPTSTPQPNTTPTIRPISSPTPRATATATLRPGEPTFTPAPPQPTINPTTLATLTRKTWLPVTTK